MNKLISNINGGFPFVLDDLRFMDDANRDAFKGIFNHLEKFNGFDGIVFHTGTSNINGGQTFPETYCFKNGELYKISSTTLSTTGSITTAYIVEFTTTYQTGGSGTKVFQDGTTHDTYQIRSANLKKVNAINPGDIVALTWNGSQWQRAPLYSYKTILSKYIGIPAIEQSISDNTTEIQSNTTEIQSNTTEIAKMNDSWMYVPEIYKSNVVKFNSTSGGDGSDFSPIAWAGKTNSWIKFKKLNNNTAVIDFNIQDVTCREYDAVGTIASLKLANLGTNISTSPLAEFTTIEKFYSQCEVRCLSHNRTISGNGNIQRHATDTDTLVINVNQPYGGNSAVAMNRFYQVDTYGSTTAESTTNFEPRYHFRGQIIVEFS